MSLASDYGQTTNTVNSGGSPTKKRTNEDTEGKRRQRKRDLVTKWGIIVGVVIICSLLGIFAGYAVGRRIKSAHGDQGNSTKSGKKNACRTANGPFDGKENAVCTFLPKYGNLSGSLLLRFDPHTSNITTRIAGNGRLVSKDDWYADTFNEVFSLNLSDIISCVYGEVEKWEVLDFGPQTGGHDRPTPGRLAYLKDVPPKDRTKGSKHEIIMNDRQKSEFPVDGHTNLLGRLLAIVSHEEKADDFTPKSCCIVALSEKQW